MACSSSAGVVSVPSTSVFDRQDSAYKTRVLPHKLPRIAVEAGVTDGWWKYGCAAVVGIVTNGGPAPSLSLSGGASLAFTGTASAGNALVTLNAGSNSDGMFEGRVVRG